MIVSFGFNNGEPKKMRPTIFDVRSLSHDTADPAFAEKFKEIVEFGRAHPGEPIAIGCDKGVHRSVVLANKVSTALRTGVYHRDRAMK